MTRLELLASQLDMEVLPHELQATQNIFEEHIDYWTLCMEAKRLIIEQREIKNGEPNRKLVGGVK